MDEGARLDAILRAVQLVRHPPSVAIVAVDGDEIILVRQTRPGAAERTLELPSGKLQQGETPRAAAERELAEECGLAAAAYREVGTFWAAPAYSTEYVHVFEATGLSVAAHRELDDDEDVEAERATPAAAAVTLSDAVSLAALALWQRER